MVYFHVLTPFPLMTCTCCPPALDHHQGNFCKHVKPDKMSQRHIQNSSMRANHCLQFSPKLIPAERKDGVFEPVGNALTRQSTSLLLCQLFVYVYIRDRREETMRRRGLGGVNCKHQKKTFMSCVWVGFTAFERASTGSLSEERPLTISQNDHSANRQHRFL